MGKISKLNLILIVISIISIGIAIFALLENKKLKSGSVDEEVMVASEIESDKEIEDTETSLPMAMPEEYVDESQIDFENSNSIETVNFVKKLIREYFQSELLKSSNSNGKLFKPFGMKVLNLPDNVDYGTFEYNQAPQSEEIQEIRKNIRYFDYETVSNVVGNFQLVDCDKGVSRLSQIIYTCDFILPSVEGTGLSTVENRVAQNFRVTIVQESYGYRVGYIE